VFPSQLIAGIAAAGVVSAMYPGPMAVDTVLGGGTSISQGLFIEVFLTAQLVFVILMLAVEKQRATYLAPLGIGTAFFLTELAGTLIPLPITPHPLSFFFPLQISGTDGKR
jgi:aquaporin related protein